MVLLVNDPEDAGVADDDDQARDDKSNNEESCLAACTVSIR